MFCDPVWQLPTADGTESTRRFQWNCNLKTLTGVLEIFAFGFLQRCYKNFKTKIDQIDTTRFYCRRAVLNEASDVCRVNQMKGTGSYFIILVISYTVSGCPIAFAMHDFHRQFRLRLTTCDHENASAVFALHGQMPHPHSGPKSNAPPPQRFSKSNAPPPGEGKGSNARGMPGGGGC